MARNQRLNAIFSSAMWIYLPMYFEHFADEVRAEAFETCVFILELLAEDSVGSRESKKNDDMIVIDNVFLQILERVVEVALTDSAVENRQHMLERDWVRHHSGLFETWLDPEPYVSSPSR